MITKNTEKNSPSEDQFPSIFSPKNTFEFPFLLSPLFYKLQHVTGAEISYPALSLANVNYLSLSYPTLPDLNLLYPIPSASNLIHSYPILPYLT